MNVQLRENLFGNVGQLGTTPLSQSMFSAYDATQAMRPGSDLSSYAMQQPVYDDRRALEQGDFERTLNQRIDSLEQREQAPAVENPDPSPRADVAERIDDRPSYRNEEPQETRRSDPAPGTDEAPESEKTSRGQNETRREESVGQAGEGARPQTPQGPVETKSPVHTNRVASEIPFQTGAIPVKSDPKGASGGAETTDRGGLLASLQGSGRAGVINPETTLQPSKELKGDPSTQGTVKGDPLTQGTVKTQINTPTLGSAGTQSALESTSKETATEALSVSKNQAGEMTQSAKASISSSVESNIGQTRPGAALPEMNANGGLGKEGKDESGMLRAGEGAKSATAQGQSGSTGSGRIDLESLNLRAQANPQTVATTAEQQSGKESGKESGKVSGKVTETNKTQSYEGLKDLSLRKSQPWDAAAGSANRTLPGKQSKLTPSLTPTPTRVTGGEQSSVMPKIGTVATPGSALTPPPGNAPLAEMPLTKAAGVKGTDVQLETLSPKDTTPSVSKQIMESIHSSVQQGQKRLTIALHPAELGRVVVKLEEANGTLSGLLEVSQKQTRAEIERALPGILQHLQSSGVQIKRLDVTLDMNSNDSGSKDSAWNEPSSDSSSSHQSRQDRQQDAPPQGLSEFPEEGFTAQTQAAGYEQVSRSPFAESGSINMLA